MAPADTEQSSSVEEHLARVLAGVTAFAPVRQPLLDCLGLTLAEDVVATVALPRFDNSAMDGYAVRSADVVTATESAPVVLPVAGQIGAGQGGVRTLAAGTAAKIMTGAPVPDGADAVVPYEWTDHGADRVQIIEAPEPHQHIRPRGDDVSDGELLLTAGTRIGPRHVGLLASVGRPDLLVAPRPRVAILATGSELRDPGLELDADSIYDGNSWMLAAAVLRAGATPHRLGIVTDEPPAFLAALDAALPEADLVITSGGVSQGDYDVVKEALRARGVWFGPVRMQPGKPQGFGLLGERRVPVVTLPGNPVSSYLSFEVFVLPALRKMMGTTPYTRTPVEARLTERLGSPLGRRQFRRGVAGTDGRGRYVGPVGGPASHLVGDLAAANCLIVIPEDVTSVEAGATVAVLMLDEEF